MSKRIGLAVCVLSLAMFLVACPRKTVGAADAEPGGTVVVRDSSEGLLLTWIDEKGDFHVEQRAVDVPIVGRDAVRIVDPSKEEGTHADRVFVADLRLAAQDGSYPVHTMTRAEFDALAVKRREKVGPTLANAAPPNTDNGPTQPNGQQGPRPFPSPDARPLVIIYGADWCTACHDAAAYLRGKGVAFVEKNVERDRDAAREMTDKLAKSGLHGGSIPVLDVKGKIMIGFNPRSVDEALGRAI